MSKSTTTRWRALSIENTLLYQNHQLLSKFWIFLRYLVEVQSTSHLHMLDHFLDLRICENRFDLWIFVYCLHNRIVFHLLFFCFLLFLTDISEVIAH